MVSLAFITLSYVSLVTMNRRQQISELIDNCPAERLIIKSDNWSIYQRLEISGAAMQMSNVKSAHEVILLKWDDKLPEIWGVSADFLKQNYADYNLNPAFIETFETNKYAAFFSKKLFDYSSIHMHEQLNWEGLYFQVKGTFETDNHLDSNIVFVNKELIAELMKEHKSVKALIFIDVRLRHHRNFDDFKDRIIGVMLNVPKNLQITPVKSIINESITGEIEKQNDWEKLIWVLLPLVFVALIIIHRFESRKFIDDISVLQRLGMTKFDYLKLSWGYVLYPLVMCIIASMITFYILNYNVWIKIGVYNIFSSIAFYTFLDWFMYMLLIFIGWWLVVYISLINNTSAANVKDHAEFIKSVVNPDKILSQSRNTMRKAKSALFKLLKKDYE